MNYKLTHIPKEKNINKADNNSNNINMQQEKSSTNNNNNYLIPISINKNIKSAFKKELEIHGIDIMNPNDFIEKVFSNLYKEKNPEEMEACKCRIEIFVKTFIFFLVNWKFSLLEETFEVNENYIKSLLKKQLFKCNYLKMHSIEEYKKKDNLQERNYFIIFNVIKSIEYKYDINIVGISSYKKQNTNCVYTFEQKFHWLIKFIDYIIVRYLSENRISPFSLFFKGLSVNNEINKFDKERDFDLYHFFSHVNEETFIKQIIYIVENVIYHLINKS